jgi:hypothetical protein
MPLIDQSIPDLNDSEAIISKPTTVWQGLSFRKYGQLFDLTTNILKKAIDIPSLSLHADPDWEKANR